MHDNRTHPLLAQVPLMVSPFVTLPVAATLPYTYKGMPSTLPAAASGISGADEQAPRYVVSASGHAAHPSDILGSCRALQAHLARMQHEADRELRELDDRLRARELAEKRRLAPGWLDSDARLLEPERTAAASAAAAAAAAVAAAADTADVSGSFAEMSLADKEGACEMAAYADAGAELDRAFGGRS